MRINKCILVLSAWLFLVFGVLKHVQLYMCLKICMYMYIQHKNHWEIRQREEEIAELQKALSDMQVCTYSACTCVPVHIPLYAQSSSHNYCDLIGENECHIHVHTNTCTLLTKCHGHCLCFRPVAWLCLSM